MITVTSPSKPFTYNAKGFPRRTPVLRDYEDEIGALYAAVEQSSLGDVPSPPSWDSDGIKAFVVTIVERVLGRSLPEDADVFRNGCDRRVYFSNDIDNLYLTIINLQSASDVHSQHNPACITGTLTGCGEEIADERHVPSTHYRRTDGRTPSHSFGRHRAGADGVHAGRIDPPGRALLRQHTCPTFGTPRP